MSVKARNDIREFLIENFRVFSWIVRSSGKKNDPRAFEYGGYLLGPLLGPLLGLRASLTGTAGVSPAASAKRESGSARLAFQGLK